MHEDFFREIDRAWRGPRDAKIELRVLGSAALMLQTDYVRGTNDGDVLETASLTGEIKSMLLAMAGKGTRIHQRHGIYLDVVAGGLPFLPHPPRWLPLAEMNASLGVFEVAVLDVVDVVVSKLKRFHANDQSDVKAMIDRELVPHDRTQSPEAGLFRGRSRSRWCAGQDNSRWQDKDTRSRQCGCAAETALASVSRVSSSMRGAQF